jgi:hypothetical protein
MPFVYSAVGEQDVRYDYIISAGDVMVSILLLVLIFSVWAGVGIFVLIGERRE